MNLQQGLMWFDKSPRTTFEEKVSAAVDAYERRFRRQPTVCYVHPDDLPSNLELESQSGVVTDAAPSPASDAAPEPAVPASVRVLTATTVLRHHFFVGLAGRAG